MTDEERKVWDEYVADLRADGWKVELTAAILAADAELKRLREAVEWTMSPEGKRFALQLNWAEFTTELRRRAKEG